MKEIFLSLLFIIVSSGLVVAGSEINMDFTIEETVVDVSNYTPVGFWDNYGNYIIGVLIILVIYYIVVKIESKKVNKRKKISKKKVRKRK